MINREIIDKNYNYSETVGEIPGILAEGRPDGQTSLNSHTTVTSYTPTEMSLEVPFVIPSKTSHNRLPEVVSLLWNTVVIFIDV